MDNYEILGAIGNGSFGTVTKVKRKSDGRILVWKEIKYGRMSEKEKQQLVTEVNILRELRHTHIVRYHDRVLDKANSKIYIVMEYCEGGDLRALIKKCKRDHEHIPEELIWKVFGQIVQALHACHTRPEGKILHRDIKPGNIFLDGRGNVKLGDFGLSRIMGKDSVYATTHVGTPYYMSPEQITESRYNEKSDIWALGCIIYEAACLHPPFEAKNQMTLALKIKEGRFERLPSMYSEELQRCISWMLCIDSKRRPGVGELLDLPNFSKKPREKRPAENPAPVEKQDDPMSSREQDLLAREEAVAKLESELKRREEAVLEREKAVRAAEQEMERQKQMEKQKLQAQSSEEVIKPSANRNISCDGKLTTEKDTSGITTPRWVQRDKPALGEKGKDRLARHAPRWERQPVDKITGGKENARPRTAVTRRTPRLDDINKYIEHHKKTYRNVNH